jgi:tRNA(fMet)-specific endonuclease VapC
MGIVIDTGVFVLWERRGRFVEKSISELDRPGFISVVTASELLVGVHRADSVDRRDSRSRFVEAILSRFPILWIELSIARHHAALSVDLSRKGTPIGYHDLWIAATALSHGYGIMTTNAREFSRIGGLEVLPVETT